MSISECAQTVMLLQSIRAFRKMLIKRAQCDAHPMAGVRDKPLSRLSTSVARKSIQKSRRAMRSAQSLALMLCTLHYSAFTMRDMIRTQNYKEMYA